MAGSGAVRAASGVVPVTLLTGFLGAGKTTLLNHLLASPASGRCAVIVNETGPVALDGHLVTRASEEVVEITDGCVCCTVRGDLSGAVARLLDRRQAWFRPLAFDRIVVECSGLASPGPVVQTFLLDRRLAADTRVDGVVTVASAPDLERHLHEGVEAGQQIGYADRVVLNHCDRADAQRIDRATAAVRDINPDAPIDHGVRGAVEPGPLLRMEGFSADRWRLAGAEGQGVGPRLRQGSPTVVNHVSLEASQALDLSRLKLFLQHVASRRAWSLIRLKGILRCEGVQGAVVAHGVYQWLELGAAHVDVPPTSRLLLIGKGLDADEIGRAWRAAGGDLPREVA